MKTYVGVTDGEWHRFLAARPALTEANFWRPSGGGFKALRPGEPFFFKTHHPHNRVVGGGFFNGFERLRISEAWDIFREANGATSLQQMRTRVSRYRKQPIAPGEDPIIGCVLLRDTCFFPRGYLAVDPEYRLRVSPRLREEFGNGEQFYRRAGSQIAVPQHRHDRPDHETLEWHLDEVFLAS